MEIVKVYRIYFGAGSDSACGRQFDANAERIGLLRGLSDQWIKITSQLSETSRLGWLDAVRENVGNRVWIDENAAFRTPEYDYFTLIFARQ